MSGHSTSGIRGAGTNNFYFPKHDEKKYEPKPRTGYVRRPKIGPSGRIFRSPYNTRGSRFDVRATYSGPHVLRTAVRAPGPPPANPTIDDLFLNAKVPNDDEGLKKMQDEMIEERKDARFYQTAEEGGYSLLRNRGSSSERDYRNRVFKESRPKTSVALRSQLRRKSASKRTAWHLTKLFEKLADMMNVRDGTVTLPDGTVAVVLPLDDSPLTLEDSPLEETQVCEECSSESKDETSEPGKEKCIHNLYRPERIRSSTKLILDVLEKYKRILNYATFYLLLPKAQAAGIPQNWTQTLPHTPQIPLPDTSFWSFLFNSPYHSALRDTFNFIPDVAEFLDFFSSLPSNILASIVSAIPWPLNHISRWMFYCIAAFPWVFILLMFICPLFIVIFLESIPQCHGRSRWVFNIFSFDIFWLAAVIFMWHEEPWRIPGWTIWLIFVQSVPFREALVYTVQSWIATSFECLGDLLTSVSESEKLRSFGRAFLRVCPFLLRFFGSILAMLYGLALYTAGTLSIFILLCWIYVKDVWYLLAHFANMWTSWQVLVPFVVGIAVLNMWGFNRPPVEAPLVKLGETGGERLYRVIVS
jgi:hypothetical protein